SAASTVPASVTFSLVIDASSMIGSYTERFTVPLHLVWRGAAQRLSLYGGQLRAWNGSLSA
ncbi:hypothetical protein ACFWGM_38470, partial [Streptomyces roseolus]|uniref:hypothetical protein n=1 Tax=Streptomyces roseolus TaxID=67358 RepID=UPI0036459113